MVKAASGVEVAMDSASRLLALLVLSSVAFAGCLGSPSKAPSSAAGESTSSQATNSTVNATIDDGSKAMSPDVGHMPHVHDYWKGKERVTLMDADVTVDPQTALFWTFVRGPSGTLGLGGTRFTLPEGATVYEGSGKMEITVSWSDPTITGMGLAMKTPGEPDFGKPAEIKASSPLSIDLTPEMTDMPHAKTTRWHFLATPSQPGQSIVGKFHVKIDVIRLKDIMVFPGHPELFKGANTLEIFNGQGVSSQENIAVRIVDRMTAKTDDDGVAAKTVVPMETRSMTANLTLKGTLPPGSAVRLGVKSADHESYAFIESVAKDEAKMLYQFSWLVEMTQTDSPYEEASAWKFDARVGNSQGGLPKDASGAGDVSTEYSLVVIAYDSVVAGASPLKYPAPDSAP